MNTEINGPEHRPDLKQVEQAPLTDWAKEPPITVLKEDLAAAKPSHDAMMQDIDRWNSIRKVEGKYKPRKMKNRSQVQPKLVRRQAEWRYAALSEPFLSSDKFYSALPRTWEDVASAKQNQLILNWQMDTKIDKVAFIDEYVRSATDEGTVIVRLGWERETVEEEVQAPIFEHTPLDPNDEGDVAIIKVLDQMIALKRQNYREYLEDIPEDGKAAVEHWEETQEYTVAELRGYEKVMEERVVKNQPVLTIEDPKNVFIDPSCGGIIEKARFVAVSFETSKAELMRDPRYKNLKAVNWGSQSVLATPDHETETPTDFNFSDELRKRVVAYEYWGYHDIDGDGILQPIVATWIGDVLIRMEKNPFPDERPPFVVVRYTPRKRQMWGEPDAELLEDNQMILGAVTRGMIDLLGRSANAQQGTPKNYLDVTNKRRFDSGQNYEYNPGAQDPRHAIFQHTYPEIPNSAITIYNLMNQDAEAISGVKAFSGGLSGDSYGDVVAGIKGVLDASSKREMNILRRLATGMKQIGVKMAAMNAVFLAEEEVVRVTNEEYVSVRREDLKGNFDLKVDISTPEVDEAKSQDLSMMVQTIGPSEDPKMRYKLLAEIAELKRMPELAKELRSYQPQPDPFVEEMKQLEKQKLEMEIAKLESEIAENHAQAKKFSSEADAKDLDYVEQESGTKHAREMEKQGAQADALKELEVAKGIMNPNTKDSDLEAAVGYNHLSSPQQ